MTSIAVYDKLAPRLSDLVWLGRFAALAAPVVGVPPGTERGQLGGSRVRLAQFLPGLVERAALFRRQGGQVDLADFGQGRERGLGGGESFLFLDWVWCRWRSGLRGRVSAYCFCSSLCSSLCKSLCVFAESTLRFRRVHFANPQSPLAIEFFQVQLVVNYGTPCEFSDGCV